MKIFGDTNILLPVPEQDINVVRGDVAQLVLGFTDEDAVTNNPAQFRVRMVLRRRQSDTLPDLASIEATLDINPPDTLDGTPVDVIATLDISTAITQSLPKQGCVYFIEWTNAVGGNNRRILQGRVMLED